MDHDNKFRVGMTGKQKIVVSAGGALPYGISPDDALLLAAWLKTMAEPFSMGDFRAICAEIENQ